MNRMAFAPVQRSGGGLDDFFAFHGCKGKFSSTSYAPLEMHDGDDDHKFDESKALFFHVIKTNRL